MYITDKELVVIEVFKNAFYNEITYGCCFTVNNVTIF